MLPQILQLWRSRLADNKLVNLEIKPEAVDPDDIDMLSDLVLAAVNDGMKKVNDATQSTLGKYTRGLGM